MFRIHNTSAFSVGVAPNATLRSVLAARTVCGGGAGAEMQNVEMAGVCVWLLAEVLCFWLCIWLTTALIPMVPSLNVGYFCTECIWPVLGWQRTLAKRSSSQLTLNLHLPIVAD